MRWRLSSSWYVLPICSGGARAGRGGGEDDPGVWLRCWFVDHLTTCACCVLSVVNTRDLCSCLSLVGILYASSRIPASSCEHSTTQQFSTASNQCAPAPFAIDLGQCPTLHQCLEITKQPLPPCCSYTARHVQCSQVGAQHLARLLRSVANTLCRHVVLEPHATFNATVVREYNHRRVSQPLQRLPGSLAYLWDSNHQQMS